MRHAYRYHGWALIAVVVVVSVCGQSPSSAQLDIKKVLVGKWEGQVQVPSGDRGRTLVVEYVYEKDGKTIASSRYGITGKGLGRVEINVVATGNDVALDFYSPGLQGGTRIVMKLQDERILRGSFRPKGSNKEYDIRLEKAVQE